MLAFALFAMFVQTMISNKFLGHGIVIGIVVLQPILFAFGWENTLYLPGAVPTYVYSDMNGYGHFVPALFWAIVYWFAIFAFLGVISIAYARRGAEVSWSSRSRQALRRAPCLAPAAGLFLFLAVGSGAWDYYNGHVLNEYQTAADRRHLLADYERRFKKHQKLPQPISQIHLTDQHEAVTEVQFDRPFHLVSREARDLYSIYALEQPLAPGEVLTLTFSVRHESRGFRDGNELPQFAYNGTFFDSEFFPEIGYDVGLEIDDPRRRREEHLGPLEEMAQRADPDHSRINLFTPHADWITYHTIVSTSGDQIGIAPGYLVRSWEKGGRRYYEYGMGSTHILDFYAYLSARYAVRKEVYSGPGGSVNLEVYYDPAHQFNVEEMIEASRAGLDYYQTHFSPYQFTQYRLMEFPRDRRFAQSFPHTVPFSEGIGFITRVVKPTDVDLTYFVTAHELGHQWWAHQLVGGQVEGSNMMSETLAQYSAYMVMQHKYGKDYMHRVMHHFLDRYLRGRAGEVRRERPLALVQREDYVWYQKGGQIMYTLADYICQAKEDLALHDFVMRYRYANAVNQADAVQSTGGAAALDEPYPDTRLLVDALRAQTPPELQYMIDDGFNRIVLYDNKAVSATAQKRPDGRYSVTLTVQARKVQADGNGVETAMPLADYIEIGVFKGKKDEEQPLYMQREKITQDHQTFTVVVDERPTRAGIDPYNKLIDRIADDNMIDVSERMQ